MQHHWPSIMETPGTVIIDDRDPERSHPRTLLFAEPSEVLIASAPDEVPDTLLRLDALLASGNYLAGYLAYDAGLVLDKPIASRHQASAPLIWLGVYDSYSGVNLQELECGSPADISVPCLNVTDEEYIRCIDTIREYIAAGDVYQVNYTAKLLFEHSQPAWKLFSRLRRAHPVPHSAFINTGDLQVISISPELFLRGEGRQVLTRPMKGTARRGRWFEEDEQIAHDLSLDPKNRAENIMIVDLMRNDIGRVCEMGGVSVPRSFHVERYGSLHQMTSDVQGTLRENVRPSDLIRAIFPPGSVTGAPKIRAMEVIDELEQESRGVYCGSIGYLCPNGDCLFNVAIRTIVQRGGQCEMGVGSGIVWDSNAQDELTETLLKGSFLASEPAEFQLLETILYRSGEGYTLLEQHLARMEQSAAYFGWPNPHDAALHALWQLALEAETNGSGDARVRLLYNADGDCRVERSDHTSAPERPVRLLLSSRKTEPADVYLYHKTTRREAYDADLREARSQGFFDALHINTRGEITECSITNVLLEIDGKWYTPPLESGLLPGIWRAQVLKCGMRNEDCGVTPSPLAGEVQGEGEGTPSPGGEGRGEGAASVGERVLKAEYLRRATRVIIGNSVRGAIPVDSIVQEDGEQVFPAVRSSTSDISGNISL